jgi:pimeloyl-ACP methyl ester carboxylesterase
MSTVACAHVPSNRALARAVLEVLDVGRLSSSCVPVATLATPRRAAARCKFYKPSANAERSKPIPAGSTRCEPELGTSLALTLECVDGSEGGHAMSFSLTANARGALQMAMETVESWRASSNRVVWNVAAEDESILLLHGLAQTPRTLKPLGDYLGRELERPTLDLAYGVGLGDIRDMAIRVDRELEQQEVRRCDVVGYSMGGLVAAYLAKCLDQGRRIRRVITIGTPHRGVPFLTEWRGVLARWRSAEQMRSGSALLELLLRMPLPKDVGMLSIAGSDDTIVPPGAARLDGPDSRNLVIPGLDHWTLVTSRRMFRCAREVLADPQRSWAPPRWKKVEPARPTLRLHAPWRCQEAAR